VVGGSRRELMENSNIEEVETYEKIGLLFGSIALFGFIGLLYLLAIKSWICAGQVFVVSGVSSGVGIYAGHKASECKKIIERRHAEQAKQISDLYGGKK
jgi:hypothetical protein